jgi:hypothetical protein
MAKETIGSFSSSTANGYTVRVTPTSDPLAASSNSLVSQNINADTDTIENKKVIMGIDIKVAYATVSASLGLEASHNGTDWVTVSSIAADVNPETIGVKTYLVDLTNIYAPYFRLHFNSGVAAVGTSGTAQFFYSYT